MIHQILDYFLHMDVHLIQGVNVLGPWFYVVLFLVIFCETGLVVTPFLPGDSLLFALGAFAARPDGLELWVVMTSLSFAAVLGDNVNYWIGHTVGPRVFQKAQSRWLNPKHLERTHAFYEKYGAKTIIFARFLPIIRTFAPFVAGIGRMTYLRFLAFSIGSALFWISFFVLGGYFFGNIPAVKKNFTLVILIIISVSVLPPILEYLRHRFIKTAQD